MPGKATLHKDTAVTTSRRPWRSTMLHRQLCPKSLVLVHAMCLSKPMHTVHQLDHGRTNERRGPTYICFSGKLFVVFIREMIAIGSAITTAMLPTINWIELKKGMKDIKTLFPNSHSASCNQNNNDNLWLNTCDTCFCTCLHHDSTKQTRLTFWQHKHRESLMSKMIHTQNNKYKYLSWLISWVHAEHLSRLSAGKKRRMR